MPLKPSTPLADLKSAHTDLVMDALAELDNICGPEGVEYIDAMMQIAAYAINCSKNAAQFLGGTASEHAEGRFIELHDLMSRPV